ncbi:MAG: carbonic anhydrase [Gammaproteobacteria bacterium MedPE]|mgnify:FL=1|nr:MAG: carbonic anhydrase [Gammaproteobacteria bacterium MedPE]
MKFLPNLFANNVQWAQQVEQQEPGFFKSLSEQQNPDYLWIGCADSRVPANEIVGLKPGELFVHRNVANCVVHTDLNCLSVIQYAVEVLKVKHIIVTGHYGCGGINSAMNNAKFGLVDNWLRHIKDVQHKHSAHLNTFTDPVAKQDRLTELHVIEQVMNVAHTSIVQDAWSRGQELQLHSWIYSLKDGKLTDLDTCISSAEEATATYLAAIDKLTSN